MVQKKNKQKKNSQIPQEYLVEFVETQSQKLRPFRGNKKVQYTPKT